MLKRLGTFVGVGVIGVIVLAACGKQEEKIEPTVTRIPATGAPVLSPTPAPAKETEASPGPAASPAASPSAVASPVAAASPVAENATLEASPAVASPIASPAATALEVDFEDIKFSVTELRIPANTDVVIKLVNKGAAPHDFTIDALNVQSGVYAAGQEGSVTINATPGTYEYYCSQPGHKQAGMVGKLIVE